MLTLLWPRIWMSETEARLRKLEALDIDRRFTALGVRIGRLEDKVASITQLEAGLTALRQSIGDLSTRIASIQQTSNDLQQKVTELQAKIDAGADIPDADVQAISDDVATIQGLAQSSA